MKIIPGYPVASIWIDGPMITRVFESSPNFGTLSWLFAGYSFQIKAVSSYDIFERLNPNGFELNRNGLKAKIAFLKMPF